VDSASFQRDDWAGSGNPQVLRGATGRAKAEVDLSESGDGDRPEYLVARQDFVKPVTFFRAPKKTLLGKELDTG